MAQRLAVLLAVASILIIACAADEPAAAYKYEKKSHSKHDKYDKPEHKEYNPEHKEYKPEHKEYKPEGYKPEGYKPDGYKPDGYKPDYHKPSYGKEYEHYGEHAYPPAPYGAYGYDMHKPYEPEYAPPSYGGYESYGEPSPYDGGYYGGANGRQIIHLQSILREDLINKTADFQFSFRGAPQLPCAAVNGEPNENCGLDLGLYCSLRHPEGHYGSDDYASGSKGPVFKSTPQVPQQVGKAFIGSDLIAGIVAAFLGDDSILESVDPINLVIFNKNQKGYKLGDINGYISLLTGADNCHPLLGPNTAITYNEEKVPVYLIFGKIEYPVDPAVLVPLGGFGLFDRQAAKKAAKIQTATESTEDYKTTKTGTKYTVAKDTLYVEKDGSLCGLALVARGEVKLSAPARTGMMSQNFEGTIEWPLVWTDLITTLPLLIDGDGVEARQVDAVVEIYLENTLDRIASLCKNNNIPWVVPGQITLDVSPVPSA